VHTFAIFLTKNHPMRMRYRLDAEMQECVDEEEIKGFEPYSRTVYVVAIEEQEAQRKLFDYMKLKKMSDWHELTDGITIK